MIRIVLDWADTPAGAINKEADSALTASSEVSLKSVFCMC